MRTATGAWSAPTERPSTWLNLPCDGACETVAFVGKSHARLVAYVDGKYAPYTSELQAAGHKFKLRVAFNVVVLQSMQMRVLEQGEQFSAKVRGLRAACDLSAWACAVVRRDSPYRQYKVSRGAALTPEQLAQIRALRPFDLRTLYSAAPDATRLSTYDAYIARRDAGLPEIDPFS